MPAAAPATPRAAAASSRARPLPAPAERDCARSILSTLARRAYRRPVTDADVDALLTFYDAGRRDDGEGASRPASSAALERLLVDPEFLFRDRARSGRRRAGVGVPGQRHRAGVAAVVLPVEQHSGRRAARAGEPEGLSEPAVLEQQVRRLFNDAARAARARREFRRAVARAAEHPRAHARPRHLRRVRREPARRDAPRDRAVPRQPAVGGSQRRRAAERGLHVRQRAARPALRHPGRLRRAIPPRLARRRSATTAGGCSVRRAC